MKNKTLMRAFSLLVLLISVIPVYHPVFAATDVPPADLFQLPWEQGLSWVAIDGLDNGSKRPLSSSHNHTVGGAIDFAPHNNMVRGENTSNFWTAAAAAGTVVSTSTCYIIIDHGNGWITQYQFLANIQVKLGDVVSRNQRLGIIADGVRQKFCPGSVEPDVPHLHFMLRPTLIGATFAGWEVKYNSFFNITTFTKGLISVGLFKPLLNMLDSQATPTPTATGQVNLTVQIQNGVNTFSTVGQVINYNYIVTNTGNSPLAGPVIVTDNSRQVTCPDVATVGNGNIYLDLNETITCTAAYVITQADINTGSVTNVATANVGGVNSNQSGVTLTYAALPPGSVLTLTKTASPQTYGQVGQTISYNFTITNTGATPLGPAQFVINDNKLGMSLPCGPAAATIATNQTLNCTLNYIITQADMSVDSLTNSATASGAGQTSAPATATITNLTGAATQTPTLSGAYVSTVVNPQTMNVAETALVTVSLNNVPAEGYTSAEFTCFYDQSSAEVSNTAVTDLFGADAATAINGPQNNRFIVAIAGSSGSKATASGAAFTFSVKGLQAGQTQLGCEARVSKGDNALAEISSAHAFITIVGNTTSTPTPNLTPFSTPTLTFTPRPSTPTISPTTCDQAEITGEINIPPGTVMLPGETFTKLWGLRNVGWCVWTSSYQLVFFSGDQMSAPISVNFPSEVAPGQLVIVGVRFFAPTTTGHYTSLWKIRNASGALFGVGASGNDPLDLNIVVSDVTATPGPVIGTPSPTPTPLTGTYDFVANACAAEWFSGAGHLPCLGPVTDGDVRGFFFMTTNSKLESGAIDTRPGLITFPQNVQDGYIQGIYPPVKVENGDRFRSIINCEFGSTSCYVAFRLDYQIGTDPIKTFWGPFLERYDGQDDSVDVDLSALAGKDVKFILTVLAAGSPTGDRAQWVGPIIYRPNGNTVTSTPVSPTPVTAATVYQNSKYNFKFTLPSGAIIVNQSDNTGRVDLPFVAGTNLHEKYIHVDIVEGANPCVSPAVGGTNNPPENVTINNIQFVKLTDSEGAAGNLYDWVTYSTTRNNACISLAFILHSHNPDNFPTPPPVFDYAAESAVFAQIVSTYTWLTLTATPTPTSAPIVTGSPIPTLTSTPGSSLTPTSFPNGSVSGQVFASKPRIVSLYDAGNILITSVTSYYPDGNFGLTAPAGTYTVVATASGFLDARGVVTLTGGSDTMKPTISLLAGDIDNNNVIDQFDAMTIGMSYNTTEPSAADVNNDGTINVLDLELLAKNYRRTGPVVWE